MNGPTLSRMTRRAEGNCPETCTEEKTHSNLPPGSQARSLGNQSHSCQYRRRFSPTLFFRLVACAVLIGLTAPWLAATENSGSVYPIGAETVMPGITPAPGQTVFAEFNTTYNANSFLDGQGHNAVPGFKLFAFAFAPKITHNWGVHVLGGTLVSWVATPVAYQWMRTPSRAYSTSGFSNPVLGLADIAYNRGNWHWWYGFDLMTPAPVYHKDGPINIGQHNFATTPSGAFTYLPHGGRTEISSRFQYIVNYRNAITQYRSGNEFLWEYVAMQNVTKKLGIGVNGYFYQQTTDDRLGGVIYADGNRGRDLAIGPEVRYQLGHMVLIAKYFRDTLVQYRPSGNAFWMEFAVPLTRGRAKLEAERRCQAN